MERNYLQINFFNFVTVTIMAFIGMMVFGGVAAFVKSKIGGTDGN